MESMFEVRNSAECAINTVMRKSTSKSSPSEIDSVSADKLPDLEFPIDPDFYSPPPKLTLAEYEEWCQQMRAGVKDNPEARLADKCTVEFVL
jgi:hypothetical protein